jgi:hypothetical protein
MSEDQRRVEELLSGLLDDELSGEERREALSLMRRDPEARALFERMRAMAEAIRSEDVPAPPPELAAKIGARLRESGGEVIETSRRRWLGPAALTAAASVAAALLIGALLHDQWEVFAPKLDYVEQTDEGPAAVDEDAPKKEKQALPAEEAREDESGGVASGSGSAELDASAPRTPTTTTTPAAPAAPAAPDQKGPRAEELAERVEPEVVEETRAAAFSDAVAREDERIKGESQRRANLEARRALPTQPKARSELQPLVCESPWTSSTRVALAGDAPEDAGERLGEFVSGLGGRVEGAPDPTLVIPAAAVKPFIEGLPGTGHVFIGPTPILPSDRDCLRLRLAPQSLP